MKSGKSHHEEEEENEYDVGSNRDATPSINSTKVSLELRVFRKQPVYLHNVGLSQWRAQSFPANPQALKNGTDAGPTFSGWFDENLLTETSSMQENQHNPLESHPGVDVSYRSMDIEKDVVSSPFATSMPIPTTMPVPVQSHSAFTDLLPTVASDECPSAANALNNQEFVIKDGTISISNTYSKALLDSFTQALETSGLDLSQTTLSVQIKIGKQPFKGMGLGPSVSKKSADNDIPPLESLEVERFSDVTFNRLRKVKLMQTNGTIPDRQLIKLLLDKSPELKKKNKEKKKEEKKKEEKKKEKKEEKKKEKKKVKKKKGKKKGKGEEKNKEEEKKKEKEKKDRRWRRRRSWRRRKRRSRRRRRRRRKKQKGEEGEEEGEGGGEEKGGEEEEGEEGQEEEEGEGEEEEEGEEVGEEEGGEEGERGGEEEGEGEDVLALRTMY
ncbi:hypothetical protein BC332_27518 [Capsicum chinense]|nr:hypothetical protein BC332_27518 [Capsicum chinense]